jgi:hypothetical protein
MRAMLQDWESGLIGNNPGTVSRLPRRAMVGRVVINLVRGRRRAGTAPQALPSAA